MFQSPDLAAKRAALAPNAIAFEAGETALSFAELNENAARLASVLFDEGVSPGERVAILCRNRIAFFEALFACAKLGAILTPLNWRSPAAELSPLIAHSAPKALLFGIEDSVVARAILRPEIASIDLDAPGGDGYAARLRTARAYAGREVWPGDDIWYVLYSSGTTGAPKAVIQTYQMALVNFINAREAFGVNGADTTLNFLPLFHTAGINLLTLPTLMSGGRSIILPDFDAARILALLHAGRLDTFFAVPAVYQQLALAPGFREADLTRVRSWGCGGAPMPDALFAAYAAKGVCVRNGFGMTETGPTAFIASEQEARTKPGSVGRAQLLLDSRIVRENGEDAAPGETGEIWMRGPGITPGYWRDACATAAAFKDGWLRSGDLGMRDAEGSYYVVGRLKEMYITGGENVYPAEIENTLASHPSILEAAVIGAPDRRWGEVGRAFILLRPDAHTPTKAELSQFCRARLAAYKAPRSFVVMQDFPRTAAGKVRKHLLDARQGQCLSVDESPPNELNE